MTLDRNTELSALQNKLDLLTQNGFELIKFTNQTLENEIFRWIALERCALLGKGAYGYVYKAYPVNPANGELMKNKMLAVKRFKGSHPISASEAKFFDSYYAGCELVSDDHNTYMIMTCLPGKNIMNDKSNASLLNVDIENFNFSKRVELIYNIMMAINLIHNNTPHTGSALIHGDINGNNINVHYDNKTGAIDVYVIDFGLSEETDNDADELQPMKNIGAPLFTPREVIMEDVHSIKSDIYSLTPIFAAVLGATNPFALKTMLHPFDPAYYKTPYDFSGILSGYPIPTFPFDLKSYITKFLNRMQHDIIDKRPDSDETLRFFTTLNKLIKIVSADKKDEAIFACGAKLAIMADGLWKDSEFNKEEYDLLNSSHPPFEGAMPIPAPEHYDFDDATANKTSRKIVKASIKSPLSTPMLKKILSNGEIPPPTNKTSLFKTPAQARTEESIANKTESNGSRLR